MSEIAPLGTILPGGRTVVKAGTGGPESTTVHKDRWGLLNYTRSARLGDKRALAMHDPRRRPGRRVFYNGEHAL